MNRRAIGAVAASATLLVGGGAAFASSGGGAGSVLCEERLASVAAERGISVEQLTANVEARLLARIDAAEKAGRISKERAARLRERVSSAPPCGAVKEVKAGFAARGMLKAAAAFLRLDRSELREQLRGTSLAALAAKQGKSPAALEAAMVAPGKARLARAVAAGKITEARAAVALKRLENVANRLANKVFPTT